MVASRLHNLAFVGLYNVPSDIRIALALFERLFLCVCVADGFLGLFSNVFGFALVRLLSSSTDIAVMHQSDSESAPTQSRSLANSLLFLFL